MQDSPFLPPRAPNRTERMAVFVSPKTLEIIAAEASKRGERSGRVASLLLAVAAERLAADNDGGRASAGSMQESAVSAGQG